MQRAQGTAASPRPSRSVDDATANPLYDAIETVGDLVRFLNAQPVAGT